MLLRERHLDVLIVLMKRAPEVVPKDRLVDEAWSGAAVTDNSLAQAIRGVREVLSGNPRDETFIRTHHRVGYQFVAGIAARTRALTRSDIESLLERHRDFASGRARLETLNLEQVSEASQAFVDILERDPEEARAHIGMANVRLLRFESTRTDAEPDRAALAEAETHAREACRLTPESADAWGTLALVRHRQGHGLDGLAAARRAVMLDPENWLHDIRLAAVTWGGERLRAVRSAQCKHDRIPLACWFAATVFVARGKFDRAIEELRKGCTMSEVASPTRYSAVGLHLLQGLILTAMGDDDAALAEFSFELAGIDPRHVYGREAIATTTYSQSATHFRNGRLDASQVVSADRMLSLVMPLALQGRHEEVAQICGAAVRRAEGSFGWMLPVEPLLQPSRRPEL
ncbi:MAG: winged helix-turn-helix domain-containing protein [Vicinamibacterales bacterium]